MNQLNDTDFGQKIKELIDSLKGICAAYGLGNDGNEFKIITQVFLYKLMNDKFAYSLPSVRIGREQKEKNGSTRKTEK